MPALTTLLKPTGRLRTVLRLLLALAVAAHVYGLYTPGEPNAVEWFPNADKVFHFIGFAVPSCLAVLLTRHWWPLVVFATNAAVSELVQYRWLPHRDGDWFDLLTDLTGLLPALGLYVWLQATSSSTADSSPITRTSAASRRPKA